MKNITRSLLALFALSFVAATSVAQLHQTTLYIDKGDGTFAKLMAANLKGARTLQLPDVAGTFALTSDITSAVTGGGSAGSFTTLDASSTTTLDATTTNGTLTVSGGYRIGTRTTSTNNDSPAATDYFLIVDASGGTVNINLPTAASVGAGRTIVISSASTSGANNVTITATGGDAFGDQAGPLTIATGGSYTVTSDGTGIWYITGKY